MVALGSVTSALGQLWPPRTLPQGVHSPILAIELLRPTDKLDQIVREDDAIALAEMNLRPRNERRGLARAVKADFAFIVAYAAFLALFGALARGALRRPFGILVIVGATAGAAFDIAENVRILGLLDQTSTALPRGPSIVKWWILFATAAVMVPLTIDRAAPLLRRWIGYFAGIAGAAAAAGGFYGLVQESDPTVETAVQRLAIAWLLAYVFAATERSLHEGLHRALDRLATWRVFRSAAKWPNTDTWATGTRG